MPRERSAGQADDAAVLGGGEGAAVRMVRSLRAETGMTHGAVQRVAQQLGYGVESVRKWVKQADIDDGARPGVTTAEAAAGQGARAGGPRAAPGERDPASARRLSSGRSSTASSAGRRVHRRQQGRRRRRAPARSRAHLQGAAGGSEHLLRRQDPAAVGARPARRRADAAARWAVGRQLRGLRGAQAVEGRPARRHRHRPRPGRPPDAPAAASQGARRSQAGPHHPPRPERRPAIRTWSSATSPPTGPNQLWVTDLTFVATWAGVAYVCFIVDAFSRMIVGWRVAVAHAHRRWSSTRSRWPAGRAAPASTGCAATATPARSSRRIRYGERLAEIGAVPSIGTVGDSLRQRAGRDRQRLLQDRADPRPGPHRTLEDRRGRRARHARLGALAQHPPPARLPRRPPARRVRSRRSTLPNRPTRPWLEIQ